MSSFFILTCLLLSLCDRSKGQCDSTLPDGSECGSTEKKAYEDPEACSMYYQCTQGCVTHEQCEDDFLFNSLYRWCMHPSDVDCGDRPCLDDAHCTTTTAIPRTTTTDCGHVLDCGQVGDGWFPDPYNCRKYWHCYGGEGEHFTCPDDQLFDLVYEGCNFPDEVECGDRPICGPCDEDCVMQPTPPPDCGHPFDCTSLPGGYYADPANCRKYWHCESDYGSSSTHYLCEGSLLYDEVNVACDWPDLVDCGDRPVCGDCDEDCVPQII